MANASDYIRNLIGEVNKVIHGKDDKITLIIATWLAGGHVLLEDVPGTGKTLLAKTIAKVMGIDYSRVQFTPDLLPSDITGSLIIDPKTKELNFRKGPIFTSIFLGDEINRATPRTQSALLEAMAEKSITSDGETRELNNLFFVIATQNPVEQHGTFPLPEAQLDRFMVKLSLGYPSKEAELRMVLERNEGSPFDKIKIDKNNPSQKEEITEIKKLLPRVKMEESVLKYLLELIEKTREHPDIAMGASPRSTLALVNLAKAYSLVQGKSFVAPSIIFEIFPYVMNHRLKLKADSRFEGKSIEEITQSILKSVKPPIVK